MGHVGNPQDEKDIELVNSLSSLCDTLRMDGVFGPMISQSNTLYYNLRWYLVSNMRNLLSQLYVEHGIVQTLIDQPVEDAYAPGFEIKTGMLDKDDLEQLHVFEQEHQVLDAVQMGRKWARLFGGGGVLVITDQDPKTPLDLNRINEDTPLEFRGVDMWELSFSEQNLTRGTLEVGGQLGANGGDHYDYYGQKVHKSRVLTMVGKAAPSFIRPRLRGWGLSEVERLVRSLNQYLKNQDVIFELLDEAKVDVYKIKSFNTSLLNAGGTAKIAARIQMANQIKNYNSALTMDAEDDYVQKQIAFTGLSEVLMQIRQGIAADVKMPITKLFGVSAAGFNSGEDDIENYNTMCHREVRAKDKFVVVKVLRICCRKLFGIDVDDLMIEFNPMRILNAKEEEEVKDSQFNRAMAAYTSGLVSAQETKEGINKDSLLSIEIDETADAEMPLPDPNAEAEKPSSAKGDAGKKTPKQD